MKSITKVSLLVFTSLFLTGCAELFGPGFSLNPGNVRPQARPEGIAVAPPENATAVEEFDTTTEAERAEAVGTQSDAAGERELGRTIASLGDPTDPGFWLETPLVSSKIPGRVVYPVTGKSVALDLIPVDGPVTGGSRISLPAIRLLGAPLAGLPELIVYAR